MGSEPGSTMELWGGGAIVLSALVYAAGSVLARPILRRHDPVLVSGLTLFGGGLVTTLGALAVEPGALSALPQRWDGTTWTMWLFLVLAGSIAGYTIYLQLVRDWGPSRAGTYCFVSPVIAVGLGMIALGETVGATEVAGMTVMLIAAWSAVRGGREPDPQPS